LPNTHPEAFESNPEAFHANPISYL